MAESPGLPGWEAPVFHGMAHPPMFQGVPLLFFGGNLLVHLFVGMLMLQIQPVYLVLVPLSGITLYGIVRLGTAYEPRWSTILTEWWGYDTYYEG